MVSPCSFTRGSMYDSAMSWKLHTRSSQRELCHPVTSCRAASKSSGSLNTDVMLPGMSNHCCDSWQRNGRGRALRTAARPRRQLPRPVSRRAARGALAASPLWRIAVRHLAARSIWGKAPATTFASAGCLPWSSAFRKGGGARKCPRIDIGIFLPGSRLRSLAQAAQGSIGDPQRGADFANSQKRLDLVRPPFRYPYSDGSVAGRLSNFGKSAAIGGPIHFRACGVADLQ